MDANEALTARYIIFALFILALILYAKNPEELIFGIIGSVAGVFFPAAHALQNSGLNQGGD